MNKTKVSDLFFVVFWLMILLMVFFSGCNEDRYITFKPTEEQLRKIEPLDLQQNAIPEGVDAEKSSSEEAKAPPAEMVLSLQESRKIALEHNLRLRVELINPTIAREKITQEQARFEALFLGSANLSKTDQPTSLALDASQSEYFSSNAGVSVPLRTGGTINLEMPMTRSETNNIFSTLNPVYTTDARVSISHPLLRNAGLRTNTHGIRVARYQNQIVEAQTKLQIISVLYAVDVVYWRLYAHRKALEVVRQDYDLAVALLEQSRRLVGAGTAAEVEIIRAEAGVAERLEGIIIAENNLRDRQRELKRVLNLPGLEMGSSTVMIPESVPNPLHYKIEVDSLVEIARENRMELLELELQLAQDVSSIDFYRNQTLPQLMFSYTYNINGLGPEFNDSWHVLRDKNFEDHYLGLRLEVPLGNQAAKSRLRESVYSRSRRLASRDLQETLIDQEVYNSADKLESTWQRVLASRQSSILAGRTLEAEQRQFEQGLRTSTDVLNSQSALANAQLAEIRALSEYEIAKNDLALAVGMYLGAAGIQWEPVVPDE
ncbi:MAG: TolC family protein [Sedimentisphaerales bacterium]|nr:TolC family protein [Sedimentisphaerales bacterium]